MGKCSFVVAYTLNRSNNFTVFIGLLCYNKILTLFKCNTLVDNFNSVTKHKFGLLNRSSCNLIGNINNAIVISYKRNCYIVFTRICNDRIIQHFIILTFNKLLGSIGHINLRLNPIRIICWAIISHMYILNTLWQNGKFSGRCKMLKITETLYNSFCRTCINIIFIRNTIFSILS